jgi:hypothetical protein
VTGDALDQIRKAIVSEQYDDGLDLWTRYATQLRNSIANREASETTLQEMGELVEWSRSILLGARSHMLDRLNTLHAAGVYVQPAERPGTIRVSL